ncbi:MAG TPA: 50S ribosomal protein L28 [bacterium]|nr:50S ribosomal protein L28 [bacterium]
MARRCAICGKSPVAGYSLSHSHIRSHRRFLPNLQKVRVMIGGVRRRTHVCTNCLKSRRAVRAV